MATPLARHRYAERAPVLIREGFNSSDEELGDYAPRCSVGKHLDVIVVNDNSDSSSDDSSDDELGDYAPPAKRPQTLIQRSEPAISCFDSETETDSSDEECFGSRAYWKKARENAQPQQHRHTLCTPCYQPVSSDLIDSVTVTTQESSNLRSKPKVQIGKTIRKRKTATSAREPKICKAERVLHLSECAKPLAFQCKCLQQCAGLFTTVAIQNFRKDYWQKSAKVLNFFRDIYLLDRWLMSS
jgi:hypothetical protein